VYISSIERLKNNEMEVVVKNTSTGDDLHIVSMTIINEGIEYTGNVELYSYGGGLEEDDMEIGWFEDENGNELDEDLIDRLQVFETALQHL